MIKQIEKTCEQCRKTFVGTPSKRFCSDACRYAEFKETVICPTCNKPFITYKSGQSRRTYCSTDCIPKVEKKPITCAGCGIEFFAYDSQKGTKFCSQECRAKVKSATCACENCGKEFRYFLKNPRHFCSRKCQQAAKRIDTTCPNCGKTFWYHASWPRIYCSRSCSAAVNAKVNLGIVELPPQHCEQCGKEITKDKRTGRRFCNSNCFGAWLSIHNVGEANPIYQRIDRTCKQCGNPFKAVPSEIDKGWGNFCCRSCAATWQVANDPNHPLPPVLYGEDNPRWKGGAVTYYGPSWHPSRRDARERDNFTCQRCGVTESELGRELDVHHIKPFRPFGVDNHTVANQLDNLISLCNICHKIVENLTN